MGTIAKNRRFKLKLAVQAFLNMHPQPTQGDWWKLAGDLRRHGYYSKTTAKTDIILTLAGIIDSDTPRYLRH